MYVVIFRAKTAQLDGAYSTMAARMRELALNEFGCMGFHGVIQGDEEMTLSYWPTEEHIRRWKAHHEHQTAQAAGRQRWYESYTVQVARIERQYHFNAL